MSEPPGTKEAPPRGSYASAVTRNYFENLLDSAPNNIHSAFSPLPNSMRNKTSVHFLFTTPFPTQQEFDRAITAHGAVNGSNEISNPSNNRTKIHEVFFQNDIDAASAVARGIEFPRLGNVRALMPRPYAVNTKQHEIKINIKKIPTGLDKTELIQYLIDTLSMYGSIKVLGRYLSADAKVFHGEAMAILVKDGTRTYSELHRVIQFKGDEELTMHLSWYNAPAFCHFCENEGHHRGECPRLRRSLWCAACRKHGHSATNCRTTLTDANDHNAAEVETAFNEINNLQQQQPQQQQQQEQLNTLAGATPEETDQTGSEDNNKNNSSSNNNNNENSDNNDKPTENEQQSDNEDSDSNYDPEEEEEETEEEDEEYSEHEDDYNLDEEDTNMSDQEKTEAEVSNMDVDKTTSNTPKQATKSKNKTKTKTTGEVRRSGRTANTAQPMNVDQC